jgi:MYXO-CTERM domain-containing protein
MTSTRALIRSSLLALALLASSFALAAPAQAQGRCSCNSGCHQYPGQCVQGSGTGCDPGFAPFCGTRATSCPNTGWVSCNGDCTCVRVYSGDAGAADAGATTDRGASVDAPAAPLDAPRPDDVASADRTGDAPLASDAPSMSGDAPSMSGDVGAADRPAASTDRPTTDAGVSDDRAATSVDAPASAGDGGCTCSGGACIDGACVTERCVYYPELGFKCLRAGTTCRLIDGEAYCVPLCAGVSCAEGEFCDESSAGRCVRDDCATRTCPAGTTCRRNQCGNYDGGVASDAAGPAAGAGEPMQGGCGCRAAGPVGAPAMVTWGVAVLFMMATRRRRSRR